MENGDLYCYAIINVGSHGFIIRTNGEFPREIKIDGTDIILCGTEGYQSSAVRVDVNAIDKMICDNRSPDGDSFLMVYRSDKTEEEVLELIRPQLHAHLTLRKTVLETVVQNLHEMIAAMDIACPLQHICKPTHHQN